MFSSLEEQNKFQTRLRSIWDAHELSMRLQKRTGCAVIHLTFRVYNVFNQYVNNFVRDSVRAVTIFVPFLRYECVYRKNSRRPSYASDHLPTRKGESSSRPNAVFCHFPSLTKPWQLQPLRRPSAPPPSDGLGLCRLHLIVDLHLRRWFGPLLLWREQSRQSR